uniref:Uncharacterized protein n=1 Tax=Arundo donax TaxID=35708 RepID=A0A0A9EM89_ARUDO
MGSERRKKEAAALEL